LNTNIGIVFFKFVDTGEIYFICSFTVSVNNVKSNQFSPSICHHHTFLSERVGLIDAARRWRLLRCGYPHTHSHIRPSLLLC